MATMAAVEAEARPLRPVARWVHEQDAQGRARLVMVWSVPDPHVATLDLGVAHA